MRNALVCRISLHGLMPVAAALALMSLPAAGADQAGELAVTYFAVAERGDPDFNTTGCCIFANDMVRDALGPSTLPLLNPFYRQPHGRGYVVHDVNGAGEITWWTPGPTVVRTGTGIAPLPIRNHRFFPPNGQGQDNAHGFQTAIFKGVLHLPASEAVSFRVGADDVAFVYIDNALIADLGGVHPRVDLPVVTKVLAAGDHCLTLFYADLYRFEAELFFSIETSDVTLSSAPDATNSATTSPGSCLVPIV
jgi:fibro-slime domain-containing protein